MGAGSSREKITRVRRKVLQRIAAEYGGTYMPAKRTHGGTLAAYVRGEDWNLHAELLRASNGEACLIFVTARTTRAGRAVTAEEALRQIGIGKAWPECGHNGETLPCVQAIERKLNVL